MANSKRTKIYRKILFAGMLVIFVCILLSCGTLYFYLKPLLENSLIEKRQEMVSKMTNEVADTMEEISIYAQNISFDETVQETMLSLEKFEEGSFPYFANIQDLQKKLTEYKMLRDGLILDIFAVSTDGKVLEVNYQYEPLMETKLYQTILEQETKNIFLPPHNVNYYDSYGDRDTISYISKIYDKQKIQAPIGTLVVLLDQKKLIDPIDFDPQEVEIELFSEDGVLAFSNVDTPLENKRNVYKLSFARNSENQGWYGYYRIVGKDIADTIMQLNLVVLAIMLLCLLFALMTFTGIVRKIVGPLEILIEGMQNVADGSRKERIIIQTGDECEQAAEVFNSMVERIDAHTKALVESEKKQYSSQIKMLSYQLNPHFIYNSLNAVICLARKEDYKEIIRLTKALMTILRSILQTDLQALSTMEEEQVFIEKYVEVLQICYKNIPNVKWEIDEELKGILIPRLILYPLVENSVFHGIVPSSDATLLQISIRKEGELILVRVEDDGVGCTDEELEEIRGRLSSRKTKGHIGLYNVNERLKLIFEESVPLKIDRRETKGTNIWFLFKPIE